MDRIKIIYELAKYCHPSWYKNILNWKTEYLRALLEYYQQPEPAPKKTTVIVIGIDLAEGEDKSVSFQWPFGYTVKDGEPLKNKMRFSDMRPKKWKTK